MKENVLFPGLTFLSVRQDCSRYKVGCWMEKVSNNDYSNDLDLLVRGTVVGKLPLSGLVPLVEGWILPKVFWGSIKNPYWCEHDIGSGNTSVLSANKPLHQPMLTDLCHHMVSLVHNEIRQLAFGSDFINPRLSFDDYIAKQPHSNINFISNKGIHDCRIIWKMTMALSPLETLRMTNPNRLNSTAT